MKLTVAIGDVHGCLEELERLVKQVRSFYEGQEIKWVFIGDYVDRGPDSKGVIDYVRDMGVDEEVVALMGNHEDMMVDAYEGRHTQDWTYQYGEITCPSFAFGNIGDVDKEYIDWMAALPLYHWDGLRTFCHAGIYRPHEYVVDIPAMLKKQTKQALIWIRHEFLNDERMSGGFVVHGHTPFEGDRPQLHQNRLNLDTACCFGGVLSCAVFNDNDVFPIRWFNSHGASGEIIT